MKRTYHARPRWELERAVARRRLADFLRMAAIAAGVVFLAYLTIFLLWLVAP